MTGKKLDGILINASNLHYGGAVQVATSFLNELTYLDSKKYNLIVSREVHNELIIMNSNLDAFHSYMVYDVSGVKALLDYKFTKIISNYKTVFTVFGPLYSWRKPKTSIVGFAQPWIIYENNEIYESYRFFHKVVVRVKYSIQKYFYFRSDKLIVELDHVKEKLSKLSKKTESIVINNCISSIYSNSKQWLPINYVRTDQSVVLLGIVTRDYPHKNLNILPDVAEILKHTYKFNVKFLVTLTSKEWLKKDDRFRAYVDNVGSISIAQCPSFYNLLDGVIFPSLLECFSATPIEAMIMKKPVFASERLFVRQACEDFVNYFDPIDPDSIAKSIYKYFFKEEPQNSTFIKSAHNQALKYCNPSERAKKYINIIR
jgi:hypothetical protein